MDRPGELPLLPGRNAEGVCMGGSSSEIHGFEVLSKGWRGCCSALLHSPRIGRNTHGAQVGGCQLLMQVNATT